MQNQNDLRVIKTKKLIKDVFYQLLDKNGLENITVSDIAHKAMINRTTFYLHYKDKYDLLSSLEDEALHHIQVATSSITMEYLHNYLDGDQPFPHIVEMLTYIQENATFFGLITRNDVDPSFLGKMADMVISLMGDSFLQKLELDEIFKKYYSHIVMSIFISTTGQWIKTGMKEPITEIALFITKLATTLLRTFTNIGRTNSCEEVINCE